MFSRDFHQRKLGGQGIQAVQRENVLHFAGRAAQLKLAPLTPAC